MQYIHFSAGISQESINRLVDVLQNCAVSEDPNVYLLFNSEGGGVWPGQHARTMLQSYPGEISVCNIGVVHSTANSVFLAVDKGHRLCAPGATFAFHCITRTYSKGTSLNMKEAQAAADATKSESIAMFNWIATRTKLGRGAVEQLCAAHAPVIRNAKWALDNGFIDKIETPQISQGRPMHIVR